MTQRKISELPAAPYKALASEAERRGIDVTQGLITDPTAVILLGALDMIRELSERIEALENASGLTPRVADGGDADELESDGE